MKIEKKLKFKNNDIYVLEKIKNAFIINDDYGGLLTLDYNLNVIKKVSFQIEFPIYSLYCEWDGMSMLLFSSEEEKVIFYNDKLNELFYIMLPSQLKITSFSPIYYWKDNILLLITYSGEFYQFSLQTKCFNQVNIYDIQVYCSVLFDFYQKCLVHHVLTIYAETQSFIFKKSNNEIGFYDNQVNTLFFINQNNDGWHSVEAQKDVFIFVYETKIKIIINKKTIIIPIELPYIFLKIKIISQNYIVALIGNQGNAKESIIIKYKIRENF